MRVKYVFDLGGDALPIDVQARMKGLAFKDEKKVKDIIAAAELLTDEGVFTLSLVSQVWARLGVVINDQAYPAERPMTTAHVCYTHDKCHECFGKCCPHYREKESSEEA